MNRKNLYRINRNGEMVDKYGRVMAMDMEDLKKRSKRKEAYPSANSMKCTGCSSSVGRAPR